MKRSKNSECESSSNDAENARLTDLFSGIALRPSAWKGSADALLLAVKVLEVPLNAGWEQRSRSGFDSQLYLHPTFLLLSAYCIENLAKGLKIMGGLDGTGAIRALPEPVKTHKIARLVEGVMGPLAAHDRDLLLRLESYAVWAGRYPSPGASRDLSPRECFDVSSKPTFWRGSDITLCLNLIEHLRALYSDSSAQRRDCDLSLYREVVHETIKPWHLDSVFNAWFGAAQK